MTSILTTLTTCPCWGNHQSPHGWAAQSSISLLLLGVSVTLDTNNHMIHDEINNSDMNVNHHDIKNLVIPSVISPSKSISPSPLEENIRPIPNERHCTKYLTSPPQNCQGLQEEESLKSDTAKRSLRRHEYLHIIWQAVGDPGREQGC